MYYSDARENDARAPKILEAHHRSGTALGGTMVLLDDVVHLFVLPDRDRCFPLCVDGFERCQNGTAFVHGNRRGLAFLINRFREVVGSEQSAEPSTARVLVGNGVV
jgi:hypothetical protein